MIEFNPLIQEKSEVQDLIDGTQIVQIKISSVKLCSDQEPSHTFKSTVSIEVML